MNINRKVGRPMKYEKSEELQEKINQYFNKVKEEEITITGLCLYLGINKDTFYEYSKNEKFKDIINIARLIVENSYEISLRKNGRSGDIFALKNFGWKDTTKEEEKETQNGVIDTLVEALNNAKKD